MTHLQTNLLPVAYRLRCQRRRRMRVWIAVGATVLAVQVVAGVAVRQLDRRTRELKAELTQAEQQQHEVAGRLASLDDRERQVQRDLQLADQLARKHRWSELLVAVSDCLPDTAVLARFESDPPRRTEQAIGVRAVVGGKRGRAQPGAEEQEKPAGGLHISGVATDHETVATFLRRLSADGRMGTCTLESALLQPFLRGEGVYFTIRTQW